jgi:alkyl hydroperoxide reductase subunit AhpC
VKLHENIQLFNELDVNLVAVSKEKVEETKILHDAFTTNLSDITIIPFLADPKFELINHMDMRHGNVAYRGYGVLDEDGKVLLAVKDDYWGENIQETFNKIKETLQ